MISARKASGALLFACLLGSTAAPATARAQTSPDNTAADVLFEEGRDALAHGDVAAACSKFEASRMLEPAVGTLLNLGECNERLARRRAAWVAFREALRFMTPTDERRAVARERIASLETKLGRLVLRLTNAPDDAKVFVDGEPISAPYDAMRLVEPGRHEVRVVLAGHRDGAFSTSVGMAAVTTLVVAPGAPLTASSPGGAGPGNEGQDRAGRRVAGLVVGGAGLAVLAGGAAFGVAALASSSAARERCGGGLACIDTAALDASREDAGTATTRATVSTVLLSAGAVTTAVGLYLFLTSSPSAARGAAAALRRPVGFEF